MQEISERVIIKEVLEIESAAHQVIEGAIIKANEIILQARVESSALIQKARDDARTDREIRSQRLVCEAKGEVERIVAQKEKILQEKRDLLLQQKKIVLKELRKLLFGEL